MKNEKNRGVLSRSGKIVRMSFTGLFLVYTSFTLLVLAITFMNSLKSKGELVTNFTGFPQSLTLENYAIILEKADVLMYLKNSILVTVIGVVGCLLVAGWTAYGLSRFEFKGKNFLINYFLVGMMVPVQVLVLPLFLILSKIGLLNTIWGMILIYISGISMSCFIIQRYLKTIPKEMEESAYMDGASDIRIFFQIIAPLCKPVASTVTLILTIQYWNDFYMPMVLLGREASKTLNLLVYHYVSMFASKTSETMGCVVIMLLPVIVIYCLFSSQIAEGITGGAIKG